jgi:PAS domain S-box-containing protein
MSPAESTAPERGPQTSLTPPQSASHQRLPWLVLLATLALTFWGWRSVWRSGAELAQARFLAQAETLENRIEERMQGNERVLLGCAGLFDASTEVERSEWRAYIQALQPEKTQPGVQGFGFARAIPAAALAAHLRQIRAEGFTNYTVRPESTRPEYTSIIYLEPVNERNERAFGFDMFTEPVRRTAMRRARDNAETAVSGKVTLVQEIPEQAVQAGFLMYVPVYAQARPHKRPADRQAALLGWAYSPFRAEDFMDEILFRNRLDVNLSVYNGAEVKPGELLYDSATRPKAERTAPGYQPRFVRTNKMQIFGQTWTLVVRSTPLLESRLESLRPTMTLAGGLALSFLLFGLVWGQAGRIRTRALAERMTAALAQSEESNQLLIQNLQSGVVAYAPDGRILLCNPLAIVMLDLPADAAQGASAEYAARQFLNADGVALPAAEQPFQRVLATGQPVQSLVVGLERPAAGDRLWLLANAFAELDADRRLRRIVVTFADITERKRAEEALARANAELERRVQERTAELGQSQAFLESVIEHSPNSLWISDAHGTMLKMNQACRDQLHLRDTEVVGKYNLLQDNLVETQGFMPQVREVFAKGVPARFVISYDTAAVVGLELEQKKRAVLDVHISPILDAQGKVINAVIQHVDITERKQAEEQISLLAAELRTILETLAIGVSFLKDRKVQSANAAHDQMFGYALGATVGLDTALLYARAEDHARVGQEGYAVLAQGGVFRTEVEMRRQDGSTFPCCLTGRAIDPHDLAAGSIWQCEDITARQQAEAKLRASEERYRLLVDTSPDTILLHREGRIIFANQAALRFFGAACPEELVGTPVLERVHPYYRQIVKDRVQQTLTEGGFLPPLEEKLLRLDGTSIEAEVTGGSLVIDGQPTVQVVVRDITERKRHADALAARTRLMTFAQTHTLEELLRATLDEVEAITGSRIGFYHFLLADQKTLSLQVWSTNTGRHMCQAEGAGQHYPVDQAGVWVDCIRERRAVIHNDYAALPHKKGLPAGHAPLVRQLVAPVLRNGQIVAILGVGNKPTNYTVEDIQSAESLADLALDIAERMRAEEALREQSQLLTNVIEGTNVGIWRWNAQTGETKFNERWAEIAGYTLAELAPISIQTWLGLAHPDDLKDSETLLREHFARRRDYYDFECRMRHKQGAWVFVHVRGKVVEWTADGQPLIMTGTHSDITERKHAEEALRASEENLRAFFNSINDFAWVLDPQGNILHVNATVTARLGYPEAELVGQSVLTVHPEARRAEAGRIVGEMLAGQCEFCPVPLVARDGHLIPVETRVAPGRWNGQSAIFGISKDVSALRASEEKFSKAFHNSPALMALSSLSDGRYLEVNESFVRTLGFELAEVVGHTATELGLYTATSQRERWLRELQERGSLRNLELAVRAKDGQQRIGLFSAEVIELQGRPVLLSVMSDITERKQAEASLNRSETKYRTLFDSTGDAVMLLDEKGFFDCNPASLEMFGCATTAEFCAQHPSDLSPPQQPDGTDSETLSQARIAAALATGGQRFEWVHRRADTGATFSADVLLSVLQLDGRPVLQAVVRDITERKQAEAKLEELLQQTQEDAQTKAELLKEVNHRVKNNLVAIIGLALAEQRSLSAEEKPQAQRFIGNLRRRIDGLLAVHQMFSDSQWAPLPVNQLAQKIIQSALDMAVPGCPVTVDLQPSAVQVSPRQASNLALVFNELATNTVKYALAGRATAHVTFAATTTASLIRLEYRDDGPGYPPEVLRQERLSVGLTLVRDLTTETLRGQLTLANEAGAVTVLEIKTEEAGRT